MVLAANWSSLTYLELRGQDLKREDTVDQHAKGKEAQLPTALIPEATDLRNYHPIIQIEGSGAQRAHWVLNSCLALRRLLTGL